MDKASLNGKHGMEDLSSFQNDLAHDSAYCDTFFLQVALMKNIFWLGFTPNKAERSLQGMELQEKEVQKD